jgi:hypothetical protein
MYRLSTWIAVFGGIVLLAPSASGQAVAFAPVIGSFPDGVTMSATPVVSADRRYVRLTMNPQFTALQGFNTYLVPAAVSGGPGGPAALGGVGFAGLNGPIDGGGGAMGASPFDGPLAGPAFPMANGQRLSASSDFEDQAFPQASAVRAVRPRALGVVPKPGRRRRGRASKPRPVAAAPDARAAKKPMR